MVRYSPEVAKKIIDGLASGLSLRACCAKPGMPDEASVRGWVIDNKEGFAPQYARARDIGLDCMADRLLDVAALPVAAERVKTSAIHGVEITTCDAVDRSKLHVDAMKWYLCKLAPKRYGDKVAVEHSGSVSLEDRLRAGRARVAGSAQTYNPAGT